MHDKVYVALKSWIQKRSQHLWKVRQTITVMNCEAVSYTTSNECSKPLYLQWTDNSITSCVTSLVSAYMCQTYSNQCEVLRSHCHLAIRSTLQKEKPYKLSKYQGYTPDTPYVTNSVWTGGKDTADRNRGQSFSIVTGRWYFVTDARLSCPFQVEQLSICVIPHTHWK